jgi:glycosyltransferase involved in cell wall biosynthesis
MKVSDVSFTPSPIPSLASGYFGDETRMRGRLKRMLRPMLYRTYVAIMRRRLAGVFAISPLAVDQFLHFGIPTGRVFPFGYFVPRAAPVGQERLNHSGDGRGPLRLVFVGNLIERKGIAPLVMAVDELHSRGVGVRLDVFGPGNPDDVPVRGAATRYCGQIPFGHAQQVISRYDALVLPSLHDGWGVVVNEAILAGVPVACSAAVGAGSIVKSASCGWIFGTPDVTGIATVLSEMARDHAQVEARREAARAVSDLLEPTVAAAYMRDAIAAVKTGKQPPTCPWY